MLIKFVNAEKIPDQMVTSYINSLQSEQVPEKPHNLGSRISSVVNYYLTCFSFLTLIPRHGAGRGWEITFSFGVA